MNFETIILEKIGKVGLVKLNRPEALNALSDTLISELSEGLELLEADKKIRVIVLTGSEKAFAAGADIKEMQSRAYPNTFVDDFITVGWERVALCRKPVIAAVAGFALGGGCEIAMMCDFILAADNAMFGQPEIKIGVTPGAGGSQRLTKAIGKAKSMEMCLTGRMINAEEAERAGLVSRVIPADQLLEEAIKTAQSISEMSLPAAMMVKDQVNRAFETNLTEGIRYERRLFQSLFGTPDQTEGMAAFVEKRKPNFN